MSQTRCWKELGLVFVLAVAGAIASAYSNYTLAQVAPDGTLGAESSVVTPLDAVGLSIDKIDGGATRGANLFHSFEQFSVLAGRAAFFNNALDIQNIITRVTGGSVSNIDGLISANGTANLFLINPNGIIFGRNAQLGIGGSFLASTASSLNLADGTQFSATNPQATPLLTVSVPIGLQFTGDAGSIINQSQFNPFGLQVRSGKTLGLVGSNVSLEGGNLTALGGRIELGSIEGSGFISLNIIDKGWRLGYEGVENFQDIQLSQQATVNASVLGSGNIQVQGGRVTLTDRSRIVADTFGSVDGGNIDIQAVQLTVQDEAFVSASTFSDGAAGNLSVTASESVELIGNGRFDLLGRLVKKIFHPVSDRANGLFTLSTDAGSGGNITINTGRLTLRDGAAVLTSTFMAGQGGNLSVTASESVELVNSGLITGTTTTGAAGNLTINTRQLLVRDGAVVSTTTLGDGKGGTINVTGDVVKVTGVGPADALVPTVSSILATTGLPIPTKHTGRGVGGEIIINTRQLIIQDRATVSTDTHSAGQGGNLTVRASESVEVIGGSTDNPFNPGNRFSPRGPLFTFLSADTAPISENSNAGNAGSLTINTGKLIVRDGALVGSGSVRGSGQGGNLTINASESVEVIGVSPDRFGFPSNIYIDTLGTGDSRILTISTRDLIVQDGGQVTAGTFAQGSAGILVVNASEDVELRGAAPVTPGFPQEFAFFIDTNNQFPSGLISSTDAEGNAGNVTINTERLMVEDGAVVAVDSRGLGTAGDIEVTARYINVDNQGRITAETNSSNGGNIELRAQNLLLLRRNSQISTTAGINQNGGNAGNITINAPFISAVPAENSDIRANASTGRGGRVDITAQGIFGIQFREEETPQSDITASSEFGVQGEVEINTPEVDPSQGLVALPAEVIDASGLIAQGCNAGEEDTDSKFTITGRGGLPPNPGETLSSDAVWEDSRLPSVREKEPYNDGALSDDFVNIKDNADTVTTTQPSTPEQVALLPATGWVFNNQGEVTLIAQAPNATPKTPGLTPTSCHGS